MPVVEELTLDELLRQMELAAETLMDRFDMSLELREEMRKRVYPVQSDFRI